MVLTAEPTTALIRLRGLPWLRAEDQLVPVSIYLGDPGVLVEGCDVVEVSWSWGASSDSGVTSMPDAGTGVIRLLDPDRKYDPLVPGSSTGIATTVRVLVAGVPAFRGRIDDVKHDLEVATLTIVDSVGSLAAVQFVETSCPAEVSSARVTRILDLAGWPADRRDIAAGGVQLQAGTIAADAWSELLEVARNELGAVWLTPAGVVAFRPRALAWAATQTEYITNSSFESVDDPALPYPFPTSWSGSPDASYIVGGTDTPVHGSRSLWIGTSGAQHSLNQSLTLTPGATYQLSAYGAQKSGAAAGGVSVLLYAPDAGWTILGRLDFTNGMPLTRKATTIVAPATGSVYCQIIVDARPPGEGFVLDLVSITGLPVVPLAELGCPPSLTYLTSLALAADQSHLVNVLAASRRGGTQRTVQDGPSLALYGRHSHVQNDLEVATDGDRDLWQAFYLTRQREPARGVESIGARPGSSAVATLLGLPFGGIVRVKDQGHGPDIGELARWLGTRWTVTPEAVLLTATLGQNQAIGPAQRTLVIDTPAEWSAIQTTPAPLNIAAREPGLQVDKIPRRPSGIGAALRERLEDVLDDELDATPMPGPGPEPRRRRRRAT